MAKQVNRLAASSLPGDWWDAHPWDELKPYLIFGILALTCGIALVDTTQRPSSRRTTSRVLYLAGLAALTLVGLMALPRDPAIGFSVVLGGLGIPAAVISSAIYVFGSGEPHGSSAPRPPNTSRDVPEVIPRQAKEAQKDE